jgi:hypothetical protein
MSVMMDIIVLNIHCRSTIVLCTTSELFENLSDVQLPTAGPKRGREVAQTAWKSVVEPAADKMMKELCERDEDLTYVDNLCLLVQFPSEGTRSHYVLIYVKDSCKYTACCYVRYI